MKAYKVFNENWKCLDFQYEVGKSYDLGREPEMCYHGFHACKRLIDCFSYYSFNPKNKVAEVELSGIILGSDSDKQCAEKIKIIKELSWSDVLLMVNTGHSNSGHSNSGDSNSGHWNSGHGNSGRRNSGDSNSGHWNSGDRNSGRSNSGHWNSGHSNSGRRNSGDSNSGDSNSGDSNSGHWNSCNCETGFFNSIQSEYINVFNKKCKRTDWENSEKPDFIYKIYANTWVTERKMSDEEKKENPNFYVSGGYLKTISYKEAWENAYKNASKEEIQLLKKLPNFDKNVFKEITGIDIN